MKTEIKFINTSVATVHFQILCETRYIIQNDILLTVELKELYGGVVNSALVQCANNVQFQSLSPTTSYELITYWTSPQGSKCYINSTNNVFTSLQSPPYSDGERSSIFVPLITLLVLINLIFLY